MLDKVDFVPTMEGIAGKLPAYTPTEGTTLTRTEEDLLGTREVPDDAYWGNPRTASH